VFTDASLHSTDHTKQEFVMLKLVAYAFTAVLIATPQLAIAQTRPLLEARTEGKELTEIRIDVVKNALQRL
jgi:hypothetical protein